MAFDFGRLVNAQQAVITEVALHSRAIRESDLQLSSTKGIRHGAFDLVPRATIFNNLLGFSETCEPTLHDSTI